jgi:hypothetical protein
VTLVYRKWESATLSGDQSISLPIVVDFHICKSTMRRPVVYRCQSLWASTFDHPPFDLLYIDPTDSCVCSMLAESKEGISWARILFDFFISQLTSMDFCSREKNTAIISCTGDISSYKVANT